MEDMNETTLGHPDAGMILLVEPPAAWSWMTERPLGLRLRVAPDSGPGLIDIVISTRTESGGAALAAVA
jgi:hypothetical protein